MKKIQCGFPAAARVTAITLTCLMVMVTVGCLPPHPAAPATPATTNLRFAHADPMAPATPAALARVTTFAFNALVVPLLDDADLPRFVDPRQPLLCAEDSEVLVDGEPLVASSPVPSGAFTLQWDLRMYCPFGPQDALLDGRLNVLVFRDDERGMEILVQPPLAVAVRGERSSAMASVDSSYREAKVAFGNR